MGRHHSNSMCHGFLIPGLRNYGRNLEGSTSKLIQEQELVFINYRDLLTLPQWQLLKAIASEGVVYSPTRPNLFQNIIWQSVDYLRSMQSLIKSEWFYSDHEITGKLFYSVYDVLFNGGLNTIHF